MCGEMKDEKGLSTPFVVTHNFTVGLRWLKYTWKLKYINMSKKQNSQRTITVEK